MILPLYARLSKRDPALEEAAADLGASPTRTTFWTVTWPLSPARDRGRGCGAWCSSPAVGEYVIPELLGGPGAQTIGRALWNEFFANRRLADGGDGGDGAAWPVLLVPMVLLRSRE